MPKCRKLSFLFQQALDEILRNCTDGVAVDNARRLWVVDSLNSRVLRFDSAAAKTNDSGAHGVLGQADFTSRVVATIQLGLDGSPGVAVGSAGRLWVADNANHWVLLFQENMTV